jgi:hypothetical protein
MEYVSTQPETGYDCICIQRFLVWFYITFTCLKDLVCMKSRSFIYQTDKNFHYSKLSKRAGNMHVKFNNKECSLFQMDVFPVKRSCSLAEYEWNPTARLCHNSIFTIRVEYTTQSLHSRTTWTFVCRTWIDTLSTFSWIYALWFWAHTFRFSRKKSRVR